MKRGWEVGERRGTSRHRNGPSWSGEPGSHDHRTVRLHMVDVSVSVVVNSRWFYVEGVPSTFQSSLLVVPLPSSFRQYFLWPEGRDVLRVSPGCGCDRLWCVVCSPFASLDLSVHVSSKESSEDREGTTLPKKREVLILSQVTDTPRRKHWEGTSRKITSLAQEASRPDNEWEETQRDRGTSWNVRRRKSFTNDHNNYFLL